MGCFPWTSQRRSVADGKRPARGEAHRQHAHTSAAEKEELPLLSAATATPTFEWVEANSEGERSLASPLIATPATAAPTTRSPASTASQQERDKGIHARPPPISLPEMVPFADPPGRPAWGPELTIPDSIFTPSSRHTSGEARQLASPHFDSPRTTSHADSLRDPLALPLPLLNVPDTLVPAEGHQSCPNNLSETAEGAPQSGLWASVKHQGEAGSPLSSSRLMCGRQRWSCSSPVAGSNHTSRRSSVRFLADDDTNASWVQESDAAPALQGCASPTAEHARVMRMDADDMTLRRREALSELSPMSSRAPVPRPPNCGDRPSFQAARPSSVSPPPAMLSCDSPSVWSSGRVPPDSETPMRNELFEGLASFHFPATGDPFNTGMGENAGDGAAMATIPMLQSPNSAVLWSPQSILLKPSAGSSACNPSWSSAPHSASPFLLDVGVPNTRYLQRRRASDQEAVASMQHPGFASAPVLHTSRRRHHRRPHTGEEDTNSSDDERVLSDVKAVMMRLRRVDAGGQDVAREA